MPLAVGLSRRRWSPSGLASRRRPNDCIRKQRTYPSDPMLSFDPQRWTTAVQRFRPLAVSRSTLGPDRIAVTAVLVLTVAVTR